MLKMPVRSGGEIERLPVGGEHRVEVEGAVAGDLLEGAGGDVDDADVAVAARRPDAVRDLAAVRREARRVGLLEAGAGDEVAAVHDGAVLGDVGDVEVGRPLGVDDEDDLLAVGAHVRRRGALARGELLARALLAVR